MSMTLRTSVVAVLFVLGSATAQFAVAKDFDPTGTWKGTLGCRTQINGTLDIEVFAEQTVKLSPGGGGFFLELTGPAVSSAFTYRGSFTPDANQPDKKGAATFVECRTSTAIPGEYNEILSVHFTSQADTAQFKGTSAYNHVVDGFQAGVCEYIFTRTSTKNPALSDPCPPKE
jgi:hypothetical protein